MLLEYSRLLRGIPNQYSKWDVCTDLFYTSHGEYMLCLLSCMCPFNSHRTIFWSYNDYHWLRFSRNSDAFWSSNHCMFDLLNQRSNTRLCGDQIGLSPSSKCRNWCQMLRNYLFVHGEYKTNAFVDMRHSSCTFTARFWTIPNQIRTFKSPTRTAIGTTSWI